MLHIKIFTRLRCDPLQCHIWRGFIKMLFDLISIKVNRLYRKPGYKSMGGLRQIVSKPTFKFEINEF